MIQKQDGGGGLGGDVCCCGCWVFYVFVFKKYAFSEKPRSLEATSSTVCFVPRLCLGITDNCIDTLGTYKGGEGVDILLVLSCSQIT